MELNNLKAIGSMIVGAIVIIVTVIHTFKEDLEISDKGLLFRGILGGLMLIIAGYFML